MSFQESIKQLIETLSKEEIELLYEMIELNVSKYDETKSSFEAALTAFENLKNNKIININADETIPQLSKEYNAFLDEFREKSELLRTILSKFKPLKEIVEED